MATNTDIVVLELQAKLDKYHADIMKGQRAFDTAMNKFTSKLKTTEAQTVSSFGRMGTVIGSIAGALSVNEIIKYSDAWTRAKNSLAVAGTVGEKQKDVLDQLYASAQRNSVPIEALSGLYGKAAQANDALGASQQDIIKFSDGVAVALKANGTSATESAGAILQLGQLLGMARVQAEEFNSVNEGARPVLIAVANGLKEAGGSVSKLKQLVNDGKVSNQQFFQAFLVGLPKIQAMAANSTTTIAQGITKIQNAFTKFIGQNDEALGASRHLVTGLSFVGDNLETIASGAVAAGAAITTAYIPSLVRTAAAQTAVVATNPFLLIAAAIGAATGALVYFSDTVLPIGQNVATVGDYTEAAFERVKGAVEAAYQYITAAFDQISTVVTGALDGVDVSWTDMLDIAVSVVNKLVGISVGLQKTLVSAFNNVPSAIGDVVISALKLMVQAVETQINNVIGIVNKAIRGMQALGSSIGEIELSNISAKIPNPFEGASERSISDLSNIWSEALTRDYVGEVGDVIADIKQRAEDAANERLHQEAYSPTDTEDDTTKPPLPPPGGNGNGKKQKKNGYEKDLADKTASIEQMKAEYDALSKLNPFAQDYERIVERTAVQEDLLKEARKAGIPITEDLKKSTGELAEKYVDAKFKLQELNEQQQKSRQQLEEWADTEKDAFKGFISDLLAGKSATEALGGALQKLADKLLDMSLDNLADGIFGKSSGGGLLGSTVGSLFGGGSGGSSGGFSLGSLFGGFKAGGGNVQSGRAYVVGEEYPELFVPGASGTIMNRDQVAAAMGGANQSAASGPVTYAPTINMQGNSDGVTAEQLNAVMARERQQFFKNWVSAQNTYNVRNRVD